MKCSFEGCTHKKHARGLCSTHYTRWRNQRDGKKFGGNQTRNKGKVCKVKGCDRPAKAFLLCDTHRLQQWRKQNPEKVKKHNLDRLIAYHNANMNWDKVNKIANEVKAAQEAKTEAKRAYKKLDNLFGKETFEDDFWEFVKKEMNL